MKWYGCGAVLVILFLCVVGFIFFSRYGSEHEGVSWQIPWLLVCIATGIKFIQSPFNSILMGLGKVKEMSKIGFWQSIISPAIWWGGLASGMKLYVVGAGYLATVLFWQIYVISTGLSKIVVNLLKTTVKDRISYFKEIYPYQWRMALSSASGYFIFQMFNPVLFATDGAVVAGQMGMTWQALFAISSLAYSWQNTKIPLYCNYIALKDYRNLDEKFNTTLKQMFYVCLVLLAAFLFALILLKYFNIELKGNLLSDRFLGLLPTIFLAIPLLLSQFVNSWATYLRCHKAEPYLWNSVANGVVSCICVLYFGHAFGLYGVVMSYCIIGILFFPWGYWIYKTKKAEWHK